MNSFKKATVLAAGTAALVMAGAGAASASSDAEATVVKSPGALAGNVGQSPFHTPASGCGNTANTGGALNPAFANACANSEVETEGDLHGDYHHGGDNHRSILDRVTG